MTPPVGIAEHDHRIGDWAIIVRRNRAAQRGIYTHGLEIIASHHAAIDALCSLPACGEVDWKAVYIRSQAGDTGKMIAVLKIGRKGNKPRSRFPACITSKNPHHLAGVMNWQRTEEHYVHEAEDSSIRANAEGQRDHRQRG